MNCCIDNDAVAPVDSVSQVRKMPASSCLCYWFPNPPCGGSELVSTEKPCCGWVMWPCSEQSGPSAHTLSFLAAEGCRALGPEALGHGEARQQLERGERIPASLVLLAPTIPENSLLVGRVSLPRDCCPWIWTWKGSLLWEKTQASSVRPQ